MLCEYLLIGPESVWIKSFYLQDQAVPVTDLYQVLEKLPKE